MDPSLIERAKKSPEAFGQIYELCYEDVYKYVFFRVNSLETAEDLTSLIWEKVLYNISSLQSNHPVSFKVWLFRIVKNCLYEYYRKNKIQTVSIDDIDIPSKEEITEMAKNNGLNNYLIQLMKGLPKKESEIITLKFFSELQNKEIANILNISEKMVAAYVSRALKALRNKIDFLL